MIFLVIFYLSWGITHYLWEFNILNIAPKDLSLLPNPSQINIYLVVFATILFLYLINLILKFYYFVFLLYISHKTNSYLSTIKEITSRDFEKINQIVSQSLKRGKIVIDFLLVFLLIYLFMFSKIDSLLLFIFFFSYTFIYRKNKKNRLKTLQEEVKHMKIENFYSNFAKIIKENFSMFVNSIIPHGIIFFIFEFYIWILRLTAKI